jgi:LytR cell envelope-related transcriptional attenuator
MARHVDPEDRSFRQSLLRAAAGGLVALIVTFGITGVLTNLGRDRGTGGPAMVLTDTPSAPQTQITAPPPSPSEEPVAASEPPATETPVETTEAPRSTITVQVLDAVGSGTQAEEAAQVLRDLGYEVVVVNPTPRRVEATTVMFSTGHEADAEALREADDRFAKIKPNADFNADVNLHVLVGPDF